MKIEDAIKQKSFKSPQHRAIVNIIYSAGWLNTHHSKLLKPYDISTQQFNIMRILRGQHPKPATVNLLQERMLDPMSNASRLVEKLRVKEMVERRVCSDDRRAVDVIITQKGLELLKVIDQSEINWDKSFQNLNNDEAEQLSFLLDKLRS